MAARASSSQTSSGSSSSTDAAPQPAATPLQLFRLYVSAASPVSSRAVVNARRFFELHLPAQHRLVVLDIAAHVDAARADQVVASPTLIRVAPLPQRRFIGDMSDTQRLRVALGLPAALAAANTTAPAD